LLTWFLEEETDVSTVVGELEKTIADPMAVLLLDRERPDRCTSKEGSGQH